MRSGVLNFSARKIEKEWLSFDVIYDFLLHVSGQIDTAVKGENRIPHFLQPILGRPQDGELVAGARSPEIVVSQLKDRNSTQSLGLYVGRLVSRGVRIFVREPHSVLVVFVRNSERVHAESLRGIADLTQRLIRTSEVGVSWVGQQSAHLGPAVESGNAGVLAGEGGAVGGKRGNSGDAGVFVQLPAAAVSWDADDDLLGGGSLGEPVEMRISVVNVVFS